MLFLKEAGGLYFMKIRMKHAGETLSMKEVFETFVVAQTAKGVSEKTLSTYHSHFRAIGKHLDTALTFDDLQLTTYSKAAFCV